MSEDLQRLLDRVAADDEKAIDQLIEHAVGRLHRMAHFILAKEPRVRRWYDTDDVSLAAAMRLRRPLKAVKPASIRSFMNLAATQIRREIWDLARHEYGPEGAGEHHDTKPPSLPGEDRLQGRREKVEEGPGPATRVRNEDLLRHIEQSLPPEDRELFDLLFTQDLRQEEAAKLLGVSVTTVKRRWRSIRLLLHKLTHLELPGR